MGARVLVIEDSVLITSALQILLESHGYDVRVSRTVADATRAISDFPPHVVLVDLTLPDGDGLAVLKAFPETQPRPKILVMTGQDDAATRARCADAGCDGVLIKPVPINDLIEVMASVIA
ncbi:MAG TPA: response regulator [Gemmatimonadaceae bacterium]